jgi:helix-turn-helix protein
MYVCILDQTGAILIHKNGPTTAEALLRVLAPYREDVVIAVECIFTWYWWQPCVKGRDWLCLGLVTALLHYLHPVVEGKPTFLPVKEAAEYLGLPAGSLQKCIREGTLKPLIHGGYYIIRLGDLHRL